jgi:hypothetical protein
LQLKITYIAHLNTSLRLSLKKITAVLLALLPEQLYGVIGKSLKATCSLSQHFTASSGFNATRLSFLIRLQRNEEELEPPPSYTQVLNITTVHLDYREVPSYFRGGHLVCCVNYGGRRIVTAERLIQVEGEMTHLKTASNSYYILYFFNACVKTLFLFLHYCVCFSSPGFACSYCQFS